MLTVRYTFLSRRAAVESSELHKDVLSKSKYALDVKHDIQLTRRL